MRPARTKHSDAAIKQLIERIIAEECDTASRGLALIVEAVELSGRPTEIIRVWGTLHYLPAGSPFDHWEPIVELGVFGKRRDRIYESIQKALRVTGPIRLDLDRIVRNLHEGVTIRPDTS